MIKDQLFRKNTCHQTQIPQINSPSQQSSLVRPRNIDFSDDNSIKDPTVNSRLSYKSLSYKLSICSPQGKISNFEPNQHGVQEQVVIQKKYEMQPAKFIRPFLSSLDMEFYNANDTLFSPFCHFIQIQYFVQMTTFLVISIYLPLQISLDLVNINYVCIFIMLFDAMIQFKTQFYAQGKLITDFSTIKQNYFTHNLRNDLLSVFSFIFLILLKGKTQWIFVLLIYWGTNSRHQQMVQQFKIYYSTKILHKILIIFQFVLLLHFLICFWMDYQNEIVLDIQDWNSNYINSLHFTIGMLTMNNTFTPRDTEQILLLSLTQIIGVFIFVSLIIEIYLLINQEQQFEQGNLKILDSQEILRLASIKGRKSIIQREIKNSIKRKLLENCFDATNLDQLIEICEEIKCQPQEVIVVENQHDDGSIYLIYEGIFSISIKQCKITQYEQYQSFGEISFYTLFPRNATITSESEGTLFKISRQKYLRQVTHLEKELYFLRRDEILFQNQLSMKCFCCQSSQHLIKNCSQLFYYPKIQEIPEDHQYQERMEWKRRKKNFFPYHFPVLTEREIGFLNRLLKEEPLASCNSMDSSEWNNSHTLMDNQDKICIQKIATIDEDKRETLFHNFTTRGLVQKNTKVKNKLESPAIPIKFQSLTDSDHSPLHPIIGQKELTNFEGQFHFKLFHPEYNLIEVIRKYRNQYI